VLRLLGVDRILDEQGHRSGNDKPARLRCWRSASRPSPNARRAPREGRERIREPDATRSLAPDVSVTAD
jgi:hypothetical protein